MANPERVTRAVLTAVDTSAKEPLLARVRHADGKEFIYLKGVASTVAGSWVTYDEAGLTALLTANAVGPVAVAMAATVANTYGWYQIFGYCAVSASDTTAADKCLYIDGTAGRVDDAVVAGDMVVGAVSVAADTTNVLPVWLNYPHVNDTLG